MSTASSSNSSGEEPNKKSGSNNEESSHLLESAENGAKYGSRQPVKIVKASEIGRTSSTPHDQENLLGNMVHTSTSNNSQKWPQYVAALAAAGGAFACGAVLGWTSPAETEIVDHGKGYDFPVDKDQFSWLGSAMTLGAACVCIPIGMLINMIGRKWTMLFLVLPFIVGWAMLIWAANVGMLYASRFILGVAGGAFCVTAPMYTGEIAQKEIRGSLGSYFQLMITVGILFVYVVGASVDIFWVSVICGALPLVFGVVFFFMPESPTYLVSKDRSENAIKSIQWLRGKEYDYEPELAELRESDRETKANQVNVWAALNRPVTRKALAISIGLMFFQQVSGINAVIFYASKIFVEANTGIDAEWASILIAIMQVVATLVSTLVVDKLGRRILLLASGISMAISTTAIGVYFYLQKQDETQVLNLGWLPVASLCLFIIMFSIGYGPVPWLMMGELFATDIKGFAGSLAGTSNWLLAFVVTKTFVNLNDSLGIGGTFWLFSSLTALGVVFVFLAVPETKGKSLNEIQLELAGNRSTPAAIPAEK